MNKLILRKLGGPKPLELAVYALAPDGHVRLSVLRPEARAMAEFPMKAGAFDLTTKRMVLPSAGEQFLRALSQTRSSYFDYTAGT